MQGADATLRDAKGKTALHLAAGDGHWEAVAVLAHPSAVDLRDLYDGTALQAAAAHGHLACVRLLLDRGVRDRCTSLRKLAGGCGDS